MQARFVFDATAVKQDKRSCAVFAAKAILKSRPMGRPTPTGRLFQLSADIVDNERIHAVNAIGETYLLGEVIFHSIFAQADRFLLCF